MIKNWLNAMLVRSIVILGVCFSYISNANEISNWEDSLVAYYKAQVETVWTNLPLLSKDFDVDGKVDTLQKSVAGHLTGCDYSKEMLLDSPSAIIQCREYKINNIEYRFGAWCVSRLQRSIFLTANGYDKVEETDFDSAFQFLKHSVLSDVKNISIKGFRSSVSNSLNVRGTFSGKQYKIPFTGGWFFFVDDRPGHNWAHPCRYVFLAKDLSAYVIVYSNEPCSVENNASKVELDILHESTNRAISSANGFSSFRNSINKANIGNALDYSQGDSSRSYALLISGGAEPNQNYSRYWGDVAMVYSTLRKKYGIPKSNISVCMSDGESSSSDMYIVGENRMISSPLDLDGDNVSDVNYSATKTQIESAFASLANKLTSNDQLFVFVTDHGAIEDDGTCYLVPWLGSAPSSFSGTCISSTEFASYVRNIQAPICFAMEFCYSGGFVDELKAQTDRVIATACGVETSSAFVLTAALEGYSPIPFDAFDYCNPWAWAFNAAIRGYDSLWGWEPWKDADNRNVEDADVNGDGLVSMSEASETAKNFISSMSGYIDGVYYSFWDSPQYGESITGLGDDFFVLKQGEPYLNITESEVNVSAEGGTSSVRVESNGSFYLSADKDWISIQNASGTGTKDVQFNVLRNSSASGRKGTIKISNDYGNECILSVLQAGMTAPARPVVTASDGTSSDSVRITWENSARALSYSIKRAESTTGNKTLLDSNVVSPYVDNDVVPGKTYYYWVTAVNEVGENESVSDSGYRSISLNLDATGNVYTKDGGESSFSVSGNSPWTVSCADDWISLITTSGNGTGIVSFTLDKNYDGEARYGTIVVTSGSVSKTITVTQPGRVLVAVNSGSITINTGSSTPSFYVSSSGTTYSGRVVNGTAVYSFDYLEIGSSVSVSISGSRPLVIESETDMKIACDLDVSGTSSGRCGGGIGGAGGSGGTSVSGGSGGSGGSYGRGGSGYTVSSYSGTTPGQSGYSGSAGNTGYSGSSGNYGTSGSSGGKGFGSTRSAASGGSRGSSGSGGSGATSVGRGGSGGYAGNDGSVGGSGTSGGSGSAGNNGSSGSNGENDFTTALTTDAIIAGSGGGGGGGGGSGGSGGGGSGGGGGGGGGGTSEAEAKSYSSNTIYFNRGQYQGAMGGSGGVGGSGGRGASSGAGGAGGAGGHGGGAIVLRAAGVLELSGCVDVSAANGSRNGASGSSASSASSGSSGGFGVVGQGAVNLGTLSASLDPRSGHRGGNGGAGGYGGSGGKGGNGGTGGYGSPGMVKLYASVLLASNGSIAGANGDNSTTTSRCGGLSYGTNMKSEALDVQKPTIATTIKSGEIGGAVSSKTASVYDESVMVPVVGQLKTSYADVAGICETGNYALSQVSSIAAEGSVEGLTVKRLTTLFDGFDQIFLINNSSANIGPVEIEINGVACEIPELNAGEVWTTCVPTGVSVGDHEVIPPACFVTLDPNGGKLSGGETRTVISGTTIGALPVPTRDGYTFLGWFTAAEGGEQVTADTVVTGDMTLYAQWKAAEIALPNLAIAVFNDWEHGYGIFTTTNYPSCLRLFEAGDEFLLVYGVGNFGEGDIDATVGFKVQIESEADNDVIFETEYESEVELDSMRGYPGGWSSSECTNLVAGVYRASVTFDVYDELEEEDEEDNVGTIPFAIRDPLSLPEGLRCDSLVFNTSGDDWYGTLGDGPDGGAVARTKHLGNDATNVLSTAVSGPGMLSFAWKVSSETRYDILSVVVDGETIESVSGTTNGWQTVSIELGEGEHAIEWRYGKDYSYYGGFDCAWLSNVQWESYDDGYTPASMFEYTIQNGKVSITKYIGSNAIVNIPPTIEGLPVTSIGTGHNGFYDCSWVTSVNIPESVKSIGSYAFNGTSITSLTISRNVTVVSYSSFYNLPMLVEFMVDNDNPVYKSYDGMLLTKDGKELVECVIDKETINIPDGVENIGGSAFYGCFRRLTKLCIPDSVTSIGSAAFHGCSKLQKVEMSNNITNIESHAFIYCYSLNDITIPDSVESIGAYAFTSCTSLESVVIPANVLRIGNYLFQNCVALTYAKIPLGLKTQVEMGEVFSNCSPDLQIDYYCTVTFNANGGALSEDGAIETIVDETIGTLPTPTRDGYIFLGWFTAANGGEQVTADMVVTGDMTLYAQWQEELKEPSFEIDENGVLSSVELNGATEIIIPSNVKVIADEALSGCCDLTSVTIPEGVVSIGYDAFNCCCALTSINIPSTVTNIGDNAFGNCTNLRIVTGGEGLKRVGIDAFYDTLFLYGEDSWEDVEANEDYANGYGLDLVRLGNFIVGRRGSLEEARNDEYYDEEGNWTWEYNLVIPEGTTGLADALFVGVPITSVEIPGSVKRIPESAFGDCCYLKDLTINEGVEEIGAGAFSCAGCNWGEDGITTLSVPSSVAKIGEYAFVGFGNLKYVVGLDDTDDVSMDAFKRTPYIEGWEAPVLIIEDGVVYGYDWETRFDDGCITNGTLYIPEGVTNVADCAFKEMNEFSKVVLPSSLRSIGHEAFYDCEELREIEGDVNLESVGIDAFYDTLFLYGEDSWDDVDANEDYANGYGLDFVRLGNFIVGRRGSLEEAWNEEYFDENENWTWEYNLVIPEGITGMADDIFDSVPITSVIIPNSVNSIPNGAFACTPLESIVIPENVQSIGEWAFRWCENLSYAKVPLALKEQVEEGEVFADCSPDLQIEYYETQPLMLPVITPTDGTEFYEDSCTVSIICETEGATIYYTTDGTTPRQKPANLYTEPFVITDTTTVKAIAVKGDKRTDLVSATIVKKDIVLAAPVITPADGTEFYEDSCMVTIACATEGASIYYIVCDTNNVTNPRPIARNLYTGPFTVSGTKMVRAFSMFGSKTSDIVSATLIKCELTLSVAVDAPELTFTTGGDAEWTPEFDGSANVGGSLAQSGALSWSMENDDPSETWMETTVAGAGTFSFWWKVDCEDDPWGATWDHLKVSTNGVEVARIDGKTEWEQLLFTFNDVGTHTIRWTFCKDDWDDEKLPDIACVDGVVWTPVLTDIMVDVGGGKTVAVPASWIDKYGDILAAADGDKTAALMLTAANGRKVWECFMLGVDPTRADDDFRITRFWMENSKPKFEFSHSVDGAGNSFLSRLKIKGKSKLSDGWADVPPDGDSSYQFFTVEVTLP